MARLSSNSREARAVIALDDRNARERLLPRADAPEVSVRRGEADRLLECSLRIIELAGGCEGDADVPEGVALLVRVVPVASYLESFSAQGEGRIGVPGSR